MTRPVLAAALVLALAAVACDVALPDPAATPVAPSGIRGTVILAPTCPTDSDPGAYDPVLCLTPYAAQLVVLDGENRVVERVSSGTDGHFEVTLPPGEYLLTPLGGDPYPIALPLSVTVSPGEYTEVQINYDTGIR